MQVRNVHELMWEPRGSYHARDVGPGVMLWFVFEAAELDITDHDLLFVLSGRGRLCTGQTSIAIAHGMVAWLPECSAVTVEAATDNPLVVLRITSPSPAEAAPAPELRLETPAPTSDPVPEPGPVPADTSDAVADPEPVADEESELFSEVSESPAQEASESLPPPPPWAPPVESAAEEPPEAEVRVPSTRSPDESASGLARHILQGPVSGRIRRSAAREGDR